MGKTQDDVMSTISIKTYLITFSVLLGFTIGCGTHTFKLESDPADANVFTYDKKGEKRNLGKTPISMPMKDFTNLIGTETVSGEFLTLQIEKDGYESQALTIPTTGFGTLLTSLNVSMKKGSGPEQERMAKSIIEHLFLAQRFAISQQFERAHVEVDKIVKEFPSFARALSMRASIYYAQKNYADSIKWYEEALKIDSQMEDVVKMLAKVKELQKNPSANRSSNP